MPGTLGQCLSAAERYFTDADADRTPVNGQTELTIQARRLVAVLGHYLNITGVADSPAADVTPGTRQVMAGMRASLRMAAARLDRVLAPSDDSLRSTDVPAVTVAGRYARAVDALAAGNDLLRSHVTVNMAGARVARSDWAGLLASEPVAVALAEEMAIWAHRAERIVGRIIAAPGQAQRESSPDLAAARDRLADIARTGISGDPAALDRAARRDLLHGIPSAIAPPRILPDEAEQDAGLCEGVAASAQRLRAAAFITAREPGASPALSGPRWRRTAQASAIACDLAAQMLNSLASSPLGTFDVPPEQLREAASSFVRAREAWRHVIWMWQHITTDTNSQASPATTDAADLVVRLGRLTFGDAAWTPAANRKPMPRAAASLADGDQALSAVLGAVHEAADVIMRMASADCAALRAVCRAGRLYMSTRVLGSGVSAAARFKPAPADRAHMLRNAYYLCLDTSWQAAITLDGLALRNGAPSRVLALARAVIPDPSHLPNPERDFELSLDQFADQIGLFTRPVHTRRMPPPRVSACTVTSAHNDEHLTVEQLAQRFSITERTARAIVTETDHPPRSERVTRGPNDNGDASQSPGIVSAPGARRSLYRQLSDRGINDPGLLERAALIDRAAADVILGASEQLGIGSAGTVASGQCRSPAQLAAKDTPPIAKQSVRHAASSGSPEQESSQPRQRARGAGQGTRPHRL